jgi:hypothetical protein
MNDTPDKEFRRMIFKKLNEIQALSSIPSSAGRDRKLKIQSQCKSDVHGNRLAVLASI